MIYRALVVLQRHFARRVSRPRRGRRGDRYLAARGQLPRGGSGDPPRTRLSGVVVVGRQPSACGRPAFALWRRHATRRFARNAALVFGLLAWLSALAAAAPPPAVSPSAPPAVSPSAPPAQWESYRVLSERNMFMRNRARPWSGRLTSRVSVATAPGTSDDRFVLTGIIQQGEDYVAFFEDPRAGKTTSLRLGDLIGRGQLTSITLDAVEYAYDGSTTKIAVGRNLAGASVSVARPTTIVTATSAPPAASLTAPAAPATAAAPTAPTPAAAATTPTTTITLTPQPPTTTPQAATAPSGGPKDSAAAAILERMRQRREQELNR